MGSLTENVIGAKRPANDEELPKKAAKKVNKSISPASSKSRCGKCGEGYIAQYEGRK